MENNSKEEKIVNAAAEKLVNMMGKIGDVPEDLRFEGIKAPEDNADNGAWVVTLSYSVKPKTNNTLSAFYNNIRLFKSIKINDDEKVISIENAPIQ